MTFQPLGTRVVLLPAKPEEKTKGGIIIPDAAKGKEVLVKGEVISVGDKVNQEEDRSDAAIILSKGDNVLFHASAGTPIDIEGQSCLIVFRDNIVAKI